MTVYCLIPVHNRLDCTKVVLRCLKDQDFRDVRIVVVDDGSSDGTADYIRQHAPDVELIPGDGSLWWSGAMAMGLARIIPRVNERDFVLFLNNDTQFAVDYVSTLVNTSQSHGTAVVGSPLKDIHKPDGFLSIDVRIDYYKVKIDGQWPHVDAAFNSLRTPSGVVSASDGEDVTFKEDVVESDALSGRGTLYPIEVLWRVGSIRHRWLPHYWADYEISIRARQAGFKLLVATRAIVRTVTEPSGQLAKKANLWQTLLSRNSRSNIVDATIFYSLCGPWKLRLTAIPRVLIMRAWRMIKRKLF